MACCYPGAVRGSIGDSRIQETRCSTADEVCHGYEKLHPIYRGPDRQDDAWIS